MTHRSILLLAAAALVFGLALVVDAPLNHALRGTAIERFMRTPGVVDVLRAPGKLPLLILTVVALLVLNRYHWRAAGLLAANAIVAGTVVGIMKGLFGRSRPGKWPGTPEWVWLRGGWPGFWSQTNVSFVSGDVAQAFAWAETLGIAVPLLRWPAYAWAGLTGVQRVAAGAHWASDAVGGAVVGVVTARVLFRILLRWAGPPQDVAAASPDRPVSLRPRAEPPAMPDTYPPTQPPTNVPYLSLVIPCYNEQENVPTLLGRVEATLTEMNRPFEVLIVDDGSTDQTPQMLAEAKARLPWLRVIRMVRNSGQSAGFEAGFAVARGRYIATIDADLQNDPEEVPRLAKLLDESPDADMITGWRKDRQDTNFRRWQSRQANKIRNWISQDDINDSASSLKIYRREAIQGMKLFNGAHRFFPALVKMRGYRVLEVPVKHSQRFAGTAKYGFRNRAFRAFIDLLGVRWMKMRYLKYQTEETGDRSQETGGQTYAS